MSRRPRIELLHGFAGTVAAWQDVVDCWRLPVRPFMAHALPGHGLALASSWDENLAQIGRRFARLHIDILVGYSLGARIALGLVAEKFVKRAILVSVIPGIADDERPARRASDARWAAMLRSEGIAAFEAAWAAQPLFASQQHAPADRRATRRADRLKLDPEQLARSLEIMGLAEMPDYRPRLAEVRDRIAVIAGADDAKYVALARAMPCRSLEIIDGSGHDPTLEQPHELAGAIARAVEQLR